MESRLEADDPAARRAELIADYQKSYGIKTIINLRGENVGSDWYDKELAQARRLGVDLVNFRMSVKREFTEERLTELVEVLQKAEKPILSRTRKQEASGRLNRCLTRLEVFLVIFSGSH